MLRHIDKQAPCFTFATVTKCQSPSENLRVTIGKTLELFLQNRRFFDLKKMIQLRMRNAFNLPPTQYEWQRVSKNVIILVVTVTITGTLGVDPTTGRHVLRHRKFRSCVRAKVPAHFDLDLQRIYGGDPQTPKGVQQLGQTENPSQKNLST